MTEKDQMESTLSLLSITQEELLDKLLDRLQETLFNEKPFEGTSLYNSLKERGQSMVDEAVNDIAARTVIPSIKSLLEDFTLQETNKWGEKKGEPVTFTEYLVLSAREWMNEPVDHRGKTKKEDGGYNWKQNTTRFLYLISSHFQYSVEAALKNLFKSADETLKDGLQEAIISKLKELSSELTVQVLPKVKAK